ATSAFAKTRQIFAHMMNVSGGGCAPSPGSNGSADGLALPSCDAAASAGTWRHKLPAARMAPGGSRTALRLTSLYPLAPWGPLAWLPSRCRGLLNPPNRRIRTRTSGGVGGEESRDSPLSRLSKHLGTISRVPGFALVRQIETFRSMTKLRPRFG